MIIIIIVLVAMLIVIIIIVPHLPRFSFSFSKRCQSRFARYRPSSCSAQPLLTLITSLRDWLRRQTLWTPALLQRGATCTLRGRTDAPAVVPAVELRLLAASSPSVCGAGTPMPWPFGASWGEAWRRWPECLRGALATKVGVHSPFPPCN